MSQIRNIATELLAWGDETANLYRKTNELIYTNLSGHLHLLSAYMYRLADEPSPSGGVSSFNTRVGENANYWVGALSANWLRDENERILLFGSLKQIFIYLNDNTEIEKYQALFSSQIESLNREENARKARGGNVAISFSGTNLI